MGYLDEISEKDEVKKEGKSPFAKKKRADNKVVRISKKNYEELRLEAFKQHTTIFEELDKLIEAGHKYNAEHSNNEHSNQEHGNNEHSY